MRLATGILLILICFIFFIFSWGNIFALLCVSPFIAVGIYLIKTHIYQKKVDTNTQNLGESCYARILKYYPTGQFIYNKKEYQIYLVVYVPSLQQKILIENKLETKNENEYAEDDYVNVQYYNYDINIIRKVSPEEMSPIEKEILTSDSLKEEYKSVIKDKREEIIEPTPLVTSKKAKEFAETLNKLKGFITCIVFYFFTFYFLMIDQSYLKKMIEYMNHFSSNLPYSIIMPLILLINLIIPITIVLLKEKKVLKGFLGFLWFATLLYMFAFS